MSIICFEGASAIGKTTTANRFKTICGAYVVPEVNLLFEKPENALPEWYFECQIRRWQIAQEQSNSCRLVILDGDPFQPFWYSWAYDFVGGQSLNFMKQFYKPKIQNETLGFPDKYFILNIDDVELRKRKEADATRQRRGFEKHLRMIEPQRRYFQAMQKLAPNRVLFLEGETVDTNFESIEEGLSKPAKLNGIDDEILFNRMVEWLQHNEA